MKVFFFFFLFLLFGKCWEFPRRCTVRDDLLIFCRQSAVHLLPVPLVRTHTNVTVCSKESVRKRGSLRPRVRLVIQLAVMKAWAEMIMQKARKLIPWLTWIALHPPTPPRPPLPSSATSLHFHLRLVCSHLSLELGNDLRDFTFSS